MDKAQPVGRIDVISDAICPWCYIGKRQLERALDLLEQQHLRFTVAWHPFQLTPEMPPEGDERRQYRIAKFGSLERSQQLDQRITETAATVGSAAVAAGLAGCPRRCRRALLCGTHSWTQTRTQASACQVGRVMGTGSAAGRAGLS